jgi:HPt (histidine-containing phosphotransfer) domain-containing protein
MTWQRLGREFDELRAEYRSEMPAKLARLDALWSRVAAGTADDAERAELRRALHTIAGSASSFGLPEIGDAARAAENFLESTSDLGAEQRAEFARLLGELRSAAQPPH